MTRFWRELVLCLGLFLQYGCADFGAFPKDHTEGYGGCSAPVISNGHAIPDRKYYYSNQHAYIVCDYGYAARIQNAACVFFSGKYLWKPTFLQAVCKKVVCKRPDIGYGSVVPKQITYGAGQVIKYSCSKNYYHVYKTSICGHDSAWHPEPHSCYVKDQIYKQPYCHAPKYADFHHRPYGKTKFRVGEKIRFRCSEGYYSPHKSLIHGTCGSNGHFDNKPYRCQKYCKIPPQSKFHYRPSRKHYYRKGEYYNFECANGYYRPKKMTYSRVMCGMDSNFHRSFYSCKKFCHAPDHKQFNHMGYSKPQYAFGEEIGFVCDAGFYPPRTQSYGYARCGEGGNFDRTPYKCIKPSYPYCKPPDYRRFHHVRYSKTSYRYGEKITYKCSSGYQPAPKYPHGYATCGRNGLFYPKPNSCIRRHNLQHAW